MSKRDDLAQIISKFAVEFISMPYSQFDEGLNRALGKLGEYANADRSYIFRFMQGGMKMENTYEWCGPGIVPQIENLKDLPTGHFPWYMDHLRKGVVCVSRVSDLPEEASNEKKEWEREGIQSIINIPLVRRGELTGFVGFDAVKHEIDWQEETVTLLKLAGEMIINALERQEANRTQLLREDELSVLKQLLKLMNEVNSVSELIKGALGILGNMIDVDYFGLGLVNQAEGLIQSWHMDRQGEMLHANLPLNKGILAQVIRDGKSVNIGNVAGDKEYIKLYGGVRSEVCVPIILQNGVVGAVNAESMQLDAFEDRDLILMEIFAGQFALAFEKIRLFESVQEHAIRDPLTDIYNRRHFFEVAEKEFSKSKRYNIPLSVIMLDMKNFKSVNDLFGHVAGDECLVRVARLLEGNLREADIAARYGGDEFVLLLPGSDGEAAQQLALRLKSKISKIQYKDDRSKLSFGINQGLAEMDESCSDLYQLLNRADQMLLHAKKTNKESIIMWAGDDIQVKVVV